MKSRDDLRVDKFLSKNNFPLTLIDAYKQKGITNFYDWQFECLAESDVLTGKNLVYSAPTSGGKTLVAEIAILKRVLSATRKIALFILPFVSIVVEKLRYFQKLLKGSGIDVVGLYSNKGLRSLSADTKIVICTIEKANVLVNRFLKEKAMSNICCVVLDELHMLGDANRGFLLELMLSKIMYWRRKIDVQVIGLSATLPNLEDISKWLDASLFVTNFRPIPLKELFCCENTVFNSKLEKIGKIDFDEQEKPKNNEIRILSKLCDESLKENKSVLVFGSSKKICENTAKWLSMIAKERPRNDLKNGLRRAEILEKLSKTQFGLDEVLNLSVPNGIAFHHSGLTVEERDVIETGFRDGTLSVLVATSTLAVGVNLPANKVIIRSMRIGLDSLDLVMYKQMSGRAGRQNIDKDGVSILMLHKNEKRRLIEMLKKPMKPLTSCLKESESAMQKILVEAIVTEIASDCEQIYKFVSKTLFFAQEEYSIVHKCTKNALKFLAENNFIKWDDGQKKYKATYLGNAAFFSSIEPKIAIELFKNLDNASNFIILSNPLYILFLLSPQNSIKINWEIFYEIFENLCGDEKRICKLLEIDQEYLYARMMNGENSVSRKIAGKYQKFFVALILRDILEEMSLNRISKKYKINRGQVQMLQQGGIAFASMVAVFCENINWREFQIIAADFSERLRLMGETSELSEIKGLKSNFAKALAESGIKTIKKLAFSDVQIVQRILTNSLPFYEDAPKTISKKLGQKIVATAQLYLKRRIKNSICGIKSKLSPEKRIRNPNTVINLSPKVPRNAKSPMSFSAHLIDVCENEKIYQSFLSQVDKMDKIALNFWQRVDQEKEIEGISICFSSRKAFILNFGKLTNFDKTELIKKFLAKKELIIFDCKNKIKILSNFIKIEKLSDPLVAHWILSTGKEQGKLKLEDLHYLYLHSINRSKNVLSETKKIIGGVSQFSYVEQNNGRESWMTWQLCRYTDALLQKHSLLETFQEIEMKTSQILSELEKNGIEIDYKKCLSVLKIAHCRLKEIKKSFAKIIGEKSLKEINKILESDEKLSKLFFGKMGFKIPSDFDLEEQNFSKKTLSKMAETEILASLVLEFREIMILLSKNLKPFARNAKFCEKEKVYKLYPTYKQCESSNGRIISKDPNIQGTIKMANLKSTNLAELGLVSRQLVVSGKHRIFVSSDFSQIEAQIATHFSQDKFLINAFKTDKDIFSMLSTDLFRTENITPKIREKAKQIFYGVLYGQGINSLAKELKISKSDCKSIESHFHNQFLSLKRLVQQCYKQSAENGFIKSFLGRKRFFDTKNGENLENGEKMSLKRKAVNSLCQSSAADLLKMALVKIEKERKKVFENSAKLVLLVHDEIVYSVDEQIVELFAKMMKNKMENCAILKNVPLKVTIKTGKNWGQMEKLFKN